MRPPLTASVVDRSRGDDSMPIETVLSRRSELGKSLKEASRAYSVRKPLKGRICISKCVKDKTRR